MPATPCSASSPPPVAVGEDHHLGHDAIEGGIPAARFDAHALSRLASLDAETEIGPEAGFGFAAHALAASDRGKGQAPQYAKRRSERQASISLVIGQSGFGDRVRVKLMPQVGCDWHALQTRVCGDDLVAIRIGVDVERQRGRRRAGIKRVPGDNRLRQHGDLVARHVDRGHALAGDQIPVRLVLQAERRRSDMDADPPAAVGQGLYRQRVVDFSGGLVVDRKCFDIGYRQRSDRRLVGIRRPIAAEACASREMLSAETLEMQGLRRGEGADLEQQALRCLLGTAQRGIQGAPGEAHLVRPHQERSRLRRDFIGKLACSQLPRKRVDPRLELSTTGKRGERSANAFFRSGPETAASLALKVDRRTM